MDGWLVDAAVNADLVGACARSGISLAELHRARARDPAFDLACVEVDESVRVAAVYAMRARAAAGDPKAARLIANGFGGSGSARIDYWSLMGEPWFEAHARNRALELLGSRYPEPRNPPTPEDFLLMRAKLARLSAERDRERSLVARCRYVAAMLKEGCRCSHCGHDLTAQFEQLMGHVDSPRLDPSDLPRDIDKPTNSFWKCKTCGVTHQGPLDQKTWLCMCGTTAFAPDRLG